MAKRHKRFDSAEANEASLFERDLTALAKSGALSQGHGLEQPVLELAGLLTRGGKAPLLAGDQGVGKSAIVVELARRIAQGTAGEGFSPGRLVEVSVAGIFARTSSAKAASELFEDVCEAASQQPGTIVFLRDAGLITNSPLVPALIRELGGSRIKFILEADARRAQELIRSDESLAERMHLVPVNEPSQEHARWILGRTAEHLELETGLAIDPTACDTALRLSVKFLLAQRLPRKAIELLRETVAEVSSAARERVTGEDVLARFCAATRLPRFMADDAMPLQLEDVGRFFGSRLLGQTDAVQAVLQSVALLKAGLNNPRRPLGVFLFAGPTGVGKTHLAKLLAEYLFGSHDRLVRLNMSDYPMEGDEHVLFGNPWGQSLEGRRGSLTKLLDGRVFTVLLLDEFEKAHGKTHDRFLQLFDEGQFINAAGETVACNNSLIVCTSNVGAEVYREGTMGFTSARTDQEILGEVDRRITATFRPEFLNRFDATCHFRPLGKVEIRRIAQREVGRVLERDGIRARQLDVEVAPEVVELLVERGYSPLHGARFLQREIEKTLSAALAIEIARQSLPPGTPVKVVAHKGRVHAIAEPKVAAVRSATAQAMLPAAGAQVTKRKIDGRALIAEAEALMGRASSVATASKRFEMEERRKELLAASQAPGFWDDAERAASILRSFRGLEARLAELERVRELCLVARRRARDAKSEMQLAAAVRAVEEAAREVRLAEARLAAGAAADIDDVWVEICGANDSAASSAWVSELVLMYVGWAQRRGYEGKVVAEGAEPARAMLHIHGPGAPGFLAGEKGAHRKIDDETRTVAYVRTSLSVNAPVELPESVEMSGREVKRRSGAFVEKIGAEVSARDSATGREVMLAGSSSVQELQSMALAVFANWAESGVEVRRYFVSRSPRVEDPRTGEVTSRVKDVLRGEIDSFIAAWMTRPPAIA